MTSTGHGAVFNTLWVQLPSSNPSKSVRPREPMTIISAIELTFKPHFFIVGAYGSIDK
jgi:hypothetical protein